MQDQNLAGKNVIIVEVGERFVRSCQKLAVRKMLESGQNPCLAGICSDEHIIEFLALTKEVEDEMAQR